MEKNFGREIALLCLPVLLFGGVALWRGKLKSWSGWGAPWGLYDGKPRLENVRWEKAQPTALDFARGISSRWSFTAWAGGACPVDGARPQSANLQEPTDFSLRWKRCGKWHSTPFQFEDTVLDFRRDYLSHQATFLKANIGLPLDLVPHDAQEVHLCGHLTSSIRCAVPPLVSFTTWVDLLIKAPGDKWPLFAGSRVPSLKLQGVRQRWGAQFSNVKGPSERWMVLATFARLKKSEVPNFYDENCYFTDAKGKRFGQVSLFKRWMPAKNGNRTIEWEVETSDFRGFHGPFTLHSWVFARPNELPLQVTIPLTLNRLSAPIR